MIVTILNLGFSHHKAYSAFGEKDHLGGWPIDLTVQSGLHLESEVMTAY